MAPDEPQTPGAPFEHVWLMLALGAVLLTTSASFACTGVDDCDDGNVCNGLETCDVVTGRCLPGTPGNCDDGNPCTVDTCSPSGGCIHALTGTGTVCIVSIADGGLAEALALLRSTDAGELGGPDTKQHLVGYLVRMRRLLAKFLHVEVRSNPDRQARVLRRVCVLNSRFEALAPRTGTVSVELVRKLAPLAALCGPRPDPGPLAR